MIQNCFFQQKSSHRSLVTLLGNPTGQWLAGSRIGIAYTEDLDDVSPGIVFPGNLTADKNTGLGRWNKDEIKTFLLTGMDHYGKQSTTVMPWPNYAYLQHQGIFGRDGRIQRAALLLRPLSAGQYLTPPGQ